MEDTLEMLKIRNLRDKGKFKVGWTPNQFKHLRGRHLNEAQLRREVGRQFNDFEISGNSWRKKNEQPVRIIHPIESFKGPLKYALDCKLDSFMTSITTLTKGSNNAYRELHQALTTHPSKKYRMIASFLPKPNSNSQHSPIPETALAYVFAQQFINDKNKDNGVIDHNQRKKKTIDGIEDLVLGGLLQGRVRSSILRLTEIVKVANLNPNSEGARKLQAAKKWYSLLLDNKNLKRFDVSALMNTLNYVDTHNMDGAIKLADAYHNFLETVRNDSKKSTIHSRSFTVSGMLESYAAFKELLGYKPNPRMPFNGFDKNGLDRTANLFLRNYIAPLHQVRGESISSKLKEEHAARSYPLDTLKRLEGQFGQQVKLIILYMKEKGIYK